MCWLIMPVSPPAEDWQWVLDINLLGVARGCKTITPLFKQQRSGHIVNFASLAGLVNAPMMSSYNATKSAVVGLSETIRIELEPFGIHTSVVCPGFFQTNLAESFRSGDAEMKKVVDKLLASSNITAEDVANDIFNAVQNKTFYVMSCPIARGVHCGESSVTCHRCSKRW